MFLVGRSSKVLKFYWTRTSERWVPSQHFYQNTRPLLHSQRPCHKLGMPNMNMLILPSLNTCRGRVGRGIVAHLHVERLHFPFGQSTVRMVANAGTYLAERMKVDHIADKVHWFAGVCHLFQQVLDGYAAQVVPGLKDFFQYVNMCAVGNLAVHELPPLVWRKSEEVGYAFSQACVLC